MRKLVDLLIVLAALAFVWGALRCGVVSFQVWGLTFAPETYWRGATGLLLFAIALMLRERR
jgi:hypothetical protein